MKTLARLALAALAALSLAACGGSSPDAFAAEYEALNGEQGANGTEHVSMEISEDHPFVIASQEEVRDLLTDGSGAIYFGFAECPWCRNAVPVMDEAAQAVGLDEIYYVNVREMRDQKSRDSDGEIVVDEEGSEFYYYLLSELGDQAPEYGSLEDPAERRITVPFVVVVVDGEIVSTHLGTVESQTDPLVAMTPEQRQELKDIYVGMFAAIPGCGPSVCE